MPDYTVSGDVDSMLRSADDAAIRSAIGVGTTDAPTFLAQTLTGQSLTGTQATSLVDLSATWNTSGTPSAIKLNVVDTASNAASNLMDLQVGGVSRFRVTKGGELTMGLLADPITYISSPYLGFLFHGGGARSFFLGQDGNGNGLANMSQLGSIGFSSSNVPTFNTSDVRLWRDAAGILAQRNGTAKQVHRVYNTFLGTTANEWGGFDWLTTANVLRIGTDHAGTGGARDLQIITNGIARLTIQGNGNASFTNTVGFGGNVNVGYLLGLASLLVSQLPAASGTAIFSLVGVSNSTVTAAAGKGTTVVGGGSNKVIVMSDGTNWVIL